jgi:DNA-directed RNA polymerase specialized sigma24 family protein
MFPVHAQRLGSLLPEASAFCRLARSLEPAKYAIFLIRVGCSRVASTPTRRGTSEVQAEDFQDSVRPGLVAILPRLKRFADLLAGEKRAGGALLGRALNRMLAEQHRYQRGTPLDRWAFAEIYRQWLIELRDHNDSVGQAGHDDAASFAQLFRNADGEEFDSFTTSFLRGLPPQQRLTLLLVYGEGFDHIDAGRVLDVPSETISTRLLRMSATLADRLNARTKLALSDNVEMLYREPTS